VRPQHLHPTRRLSETSLVLPAKRLDVGFAVRIEQFLAALLPRPFEFGRCDVPVRPAHSDYGAEVLAELLQSGPAEEPVAVVDLINDKTGLEERKGQWAPTPLRYSFVRVILSVLIVTSRQ
jgi:hypothetical protein